jgi:proteasome accessory factor PafA2
MPVPKIVGIETEYGIALRAGVASLHVTQGFFAGGWDKPILWDYATESPAKDARGLSYAAAGLSSGWRRPTQNAQPLPAPGSEAEEVGQDARSSVTLSIGGDLSTILPNGARFYIDHAHPEYCTPECATARELVAYDKAGEQLLMQMLHRYNEERDPDDQIVLYKNNSDRQGHSYGCHENYLMAADVYEDLFNDKAHWLYAYLLPYLVSRQIFCGAGKVGVEQRTGQLDYQISQRADFFERVIGLQTMYDRPIINTRDEPHADLARFRRLHVICGDANMAEWSTYFKVAVTQLLLTMLEAEAFQLAEDVVLADPVAAFKTISCDPGLKVKVRLEHGQRQYTALEIQQVFLDAARRYLDRDAVANARWHQVWENWAQVIGWLEREPEALDRRLDWRIKRRFLQSQLERKGVNWQDPVARELDIKYHQLDHGAGFYYLLLDAGLVETLLSEEEISRAMLAPPDSTRAYLRGRCAQDYADQVLSANWDVISLRVGSGDERHTVRLHLPDPTAYTRSQVEPILEANAELEHAVAELKRHPSRIREV